MCAGTRMAASSSQQHRGKEVESLVLCSEGKSENKQLKSGVLKKRVYIITESKDTTSSTAASFKNVNILWPQRESFELRTRVTLSSLPTKKCYSTCRQ